MYEASDLRKGLKIEIEGDPYVITDFDFSKPGKGQAIYRVRMKNMLTGYSVDKSYRSNDKFKPADLMSTKMEYLYFDGQNYCFMNPTTFENELADATVIGDNKSYMLENTEVDVLFYGEFRHWTIRVSRQSGIRHIKEAREQAGHGLKPRSRLVLLPA